MNTTTQPSEAQWNATNRFLAQMLLSPPLTNDYLDASKQANDLDNPSQFLDNWLEQQGYDTTPALVNAAILAWQNTSLSFWTGYYGQSFVDDNQPAPVLSIAPDAVGDFVPYLDGVALLNYRFVSKNGHPTLSWDLDTNTTAGDITFYYTSPIITDPEQTVGYTGTWFQGWLQDSLTSSKQSTPPTMQVIASQ